jgi:hypothetical protein
VHHTKWPDSRAGRSSPASPGRINRQGLDILVHPHTDDEVEDHTTQPVWLGQLVNLLTDRLKHAPTIRELQPT